MDPPAVPECSCAFSATSLFMCSRPGGAELNRQGQTFKQGRNSLAELAYVDIFSLHVSDFPGDDDVSRFGP